MTKLTKNLTVLMALILCVTVGGVYAAWSYAANAELSEAVNKGVSLTPVSQSGSLGEYEVGYDEFSVVIDQTAPGDYTPKLSIYAASDDGSLNFKFTPAIVASDDLKANGLRSLVSFSSTLTYGDPAAPIFTFPTTFTIGQVGDATTDYAWTAVDSNSDGTTDYFECFIPNTDLADYIQLAYTEKLDTYEKYKAFETALTTGTLNIIISHDVPAAS